MAAQTAVIGWTLQVGLSQMPTSHPVLLFTPYIAEQRSRKLSYQLLG